MLDNPLIFRQEETRLPPAPMVSFDSTRPDFAPYGFTCVRWKPTVMRRADRHNEIELNFLGSGWVTYLLGGEKVRVEAGHLSAFWAAIPHQVIDYARELEYFVATIPLAWFLQCRLPDRLVQPLLHGRMISSLSSARANPDEDLFAAWERDLQTADPRLTRAVLLEMEARLLRLAITTAGAEGSLDSTGEKSRSASTEGDLNKVEQIASFIAQHYTEPLTVSTIAEAVRLHPNYAMLLFRKAFGTSLIEYLTQHRVSHAQRLLVTSDMKILDIAMESGFGSLSRFNDAFRRACGCSPRAYRQDHMS